MNRWSSAGSGSGYYWLTTRSRSATVDGRCLLSVDRHLCGVPCSSVLDPLLFLLYTSQLFDVIVDFAFG